MEKDKADCTSEDFQGVSKESSLCTKAKSHCLNTKIENSDNNPKLLFNLTNNLLGNKTGSTTPSHTNSLDLANSFVTYFEEKISNIRKIFKIDNQTQSVNTHDEIQAENFPSFAKVSEHDLNKMILSGNSKTCI